MNMDATLVNRQVNKTQNTGKQSALPPMYSTMIQGLPNASTVVPCPIGLRDIHVYICIYQYRKASFAVMKSEWQIGKGSELCLFPLGQLRHWPKREAGRPRENCARPFLMMTQRESPC